MQRNIKILAVILLLAALICTAVACKKNGNNEVPEEALGEYYSMSGTAENLLKIEAEGKFTFVYEGKEMSGNVTLEDSTLVFKADGESIATGAVVQNSIELQYNGSTVTLLKKINFTLTFDSQSGSEVAAQTVVNGKAGSVPLNPTRDGHKFVGWYTDGEYTAEFDFSAPITASTTAYARWSKMEYDTEYTVSFDLNYEGAPTLASVQTIGNKLFKLEAPVRAGYIFKGWYVSQYYTPEKLSYLYTAAKTVIGEDTTLYALWQPENAELQAPVLTVNNSNVTWERVEGAGVTYRVTVKGPNGNYIKNNESTSNPLVSGVITAGGDYEITVTAVRGSSSASSTIYYRLKPLESVSDFTVSGKVVQFTPVTHAQRYLITVICADSEHCIESLEITDTQYDFSSCAIGADGIKVSVVAAADGYANSLASEKTVTPAELGLTADTITLNKGDYGTLRETSSAVLQGFRYVLPIPERDASSEYYFVGWYADAAHTVPLTDTDGRSLDVWNGAGDVQAYAYWVSGVFQYNLMTVGGAQAFEISAGENFNLFTSVTIPSSYLTMPVARIQSSGFANQTHVTKINIPDTVLEIGDGAFAGCASLTELNIYDAGNSSDAFMSEGGILFAIDRYTSNLSLFKMPDGIVGKYTVPDNVVSIASTAFEGSGITEVIISANVTNIGVEAFANSKLTRITFADGSKALAISERAFMNTGLTEINLPARLTSIALKRLEICSVTSGYTTTIEPVTDTSKATDAFYGCTELVTITVDSASKTYKAIGNVLFSADAKTLLYAPYTLSGAYTVPVNTQTIGDGAFYGTGITEVTIANTVTNIGEGAFFANTSLVTVRFSELASVGGITIGRYAFGTTSVIENALKYFIINDNTKIQTICDYAFYYSKSLEEIHISQFTTSIGKEAFAFCRGATSIDFSVGNEISNAVLQIGENAFKSVPVASITLGSSLREFPTSAFSDTSKLAEILVADGHDSLVSIDGVLYTKVGGQPHTLIVFPDAKGGAFVIPDGVVEIANDAFKYKKLLQSVTIPASVVKIGSSAFEQGYETALAEIIFTGTPEAGAELIIGDKAFYNAGLVSSITLPSHTKSIGENVFYQLGLRVTGAPSITLNEGLEHIGASAYAKTRIEAVVIPSSVKTIGKSAFASITTLTSVSFGTSSELIEIGERAFYGCPISSIVIPASVEVIGTLAFASGISFEENDSGDVVISSGSSAGGLQSVTFEAGSSLKTISAFAFAGSGIQSIVIPKSVTYVGAYAFAGTSGYLKSVIFEEGGTETTVIGASESVTVPVGAGVWAVDTACTFAGHVFDGAALSTLTLPADYDAHEDAFVNSGLTEE